MTNREVISMFNDLSSIKKLKLPAIVGRAIAKNIDKLQSEMKYIDEQILKIKENYAEKDVDGKAVIAGGEYKMSETDKMKCIEEQNEFFDASAEIDFVKIKEEDLDKCELSERFDVLTVEQNCAVLFMITKTE